MIVDFENIFEAKERVYGSALLDRGTALRMLDLCFVINCNSSFVSVI